MRREPRRPLVVDDRPMRRRPAPGALRRDRVPRSRLPPEAAYGQVVSVLAVQAPAAQLTVSRSDAALP
jgi:hypothetical protein